MEETTWTGSTAGEPLVVRMGEDGLCTCTCADRCPAGKSGMSSRCTREQVEAAGGRAVAPDSPDGILMRYFDVGSCTGSYLEALRAMKRAEEGDWRWNPKLRGSGIIECIPQSGPCPMGCEDCFFQNGRSYLEPLSENLPHVPTTEMADGRIVRMNDGNDSNVQRDLVERVAQQYTDFFFNTSIPHDLGRFPGPVVLTVNPAKMTDTDFHKLDKALPNLMYVRVRVNTWNLHTVVRPAVEHYTGLGVPVVLTYMAYYTSIIPEEHRGAYEWKKRTTNPYWVITQEWADFIESMFKDNTLVYSCGRRGQYACFLCGNCLREYHAAKERIRLARETRKEKG